MNERWEYKVDKINMVAKGLEEALLERGAEGYELVTAYRDGPFVLAIFKKPVPNA